LNFSKHTRSSFVGNHGKNEGSQGKGDILNFRPKLPLHADTEYARLCLPSRESMMRADHHIRVDYRNRAGLMMAEFKKENDNGTSGTTGSHRT
jgi:hypothetical protein